MVNAGASIEAFLKLDASQFKTGLESVSATVTKFKESMLDIGKNATQFTAGLNNTSRAITKLMESMEKLDAVDSKAITKFKNLATALQNIATAAQRMSVDVQRGSVGMEMLSTVIDIFNTGVSSAEVHLKATNAQLQALARNTVGAKESVSTLKTSFDSVKADLQAMQTGMYRYGTVMSDVEAKVIYQTQQMKEQYRTARAELLAFANGGVEAFNLISANTNTLNSTLGAGTSRINMYRTAWTQLTSTMASYGSTMNTVSTTLSNLSTQFSRLGAEESRVVASITNASGEFARLKAEMGQVSESYRILRINSEGENVTLEKSSQALAKNSAEMLKNAEAKLRAMGYTGQITAGKQRETSAVNQNTSSHIRNASAMGQSVGRANQLTSATSRLSKAMSSLRMIGNLVGSMLAYNFAHKLLVATGETIHAKSEMEGYFKMLNFGQSDINQFNQALDRTVAQFQRVNKYSLGETISSIGVEFNLTTQEMEKAMKVTSMITSEYLRAGRNANEASLAVKDVLQGQFQRLSRETGVKGEQLKEAGWSGDTTDVLGLMEALEKVGKSRNWDVFAEKANSLNDILTILQNRFGEWSADMVNVVQPSIVGAFNAIMSVAQGFANVLGGAWQWLNTDGWGQLAIKIGAVSSAFFVGVHALTAYRGGATLAQVANMGLTKSLGSLVLGIKAEDMANRSLSQAMAIRLAGTNAEKVAEIGLTNALNQALFTKGLYKTTTEAQTLASSLNEGVLIGEATAISLVKDEETGAIILKQGLSLATTENTTTTIGFTGALSMMIAGEQLAEGETLSLAGTLGALTGAFLASPIGWFTLAILGLASATYVLTGGLDSMWGSLQNATTAVNDASSATKPYRDYVDQTNKELEEAKEKYGENSLVVQALSEKYDRAKDSLDAYYEKLQQATSQHGKLNDELGVTSAKMDEIMRAELGDVGYGEAELDEMTTGISDLSRLQDHDYVAMQKHSAMLGNFSDSIHHFAEVADGDTEAIQNFGRTYYDFINYSDKANTADNWWDWATNSFMAGVSGKSLDIQKVLKGVWDTDKDPNAYRDFTKTIFDGLGNAWNETSKEWGNTLNNIDWGAFGDIGGRFSQWIDDAKKSIGDSWNSLTEIFKPITDFFNDPWKILGFDSVSASDGSSDHPSFMEDLSSILGFDIQAWIDSFMADPLGDLGGFDILGTLVNFLFGTGSDDPNDISWALTFLQNNIITPITETWSAFISDPIGFMGDMGFTITGFLDSIFGTDVFTQIWDWTFNTIVQPFSQSLWNGIMTIPLVSDILQLFGLVDGENSGSSQKGKDLGEAFKTAIEDKIRNIPILGDILQLLGLIPSANDDAHSKGKGVGENVDKGYKDGTSNLVSEAIKEFQDIANGIRDKAGEAYGAAKHYAGQVWEGLNSVFQRASPGFFHDQVLLEFGTDMPNAMLSSADTAYTSAQYYAQQISDGISSVNTDSLGLDTAVGNYETDAQMIAMSSQMMGMETTTAFNDMSLAVNNTTATMSSNVGTTYSQMQQKQTSSLQSMKTQNQTAYNEMYLKSNQSLIQMRDSTTNITHQMINAWSHMKTQLVATANQLRSESTSHFNRLSETIGSFYRKIQNPSNWGAGTGSSTPVRSRRNTTAGRSFARGMRTRTSLHGAGTSSTYSGSKYMTIGSLKRKLCPDGSCDYLFNGMDSSERVNVEDFLASITGEHGFGGWSGWDKTHFNYIKNTSDQWSMGSPVIQVMGGIPTNAQFKVGDFENGTPSISFDSFKSMAESIFAPGGIPYKHYMDSSWKGSWLGAIQSGACNCSDGAEAIIAFASACGFGGGQKVHGYWGNEGHFWAVINGEVFDTTAMQKGYGWRSPSVHGYGTKVRTTVSSGDAPTNGNRTLNLTVNINEPVYGVDDLKEQIVEASREAMREEFNDPYTVELI